MGFKEFSMVFTKCMRLEDPKTCKRSQKATKGRNDINIAEYDEEENPFANIDEYIEDTNAIVPPRVDAATFKNNVSDDALRLRVFKYSLVGEARKWIQNLPPHSIHSWPELVCAFFAKWFPQSKKSELRDKIFFFKQLPGEHLHEAWDRFKLYLARSPNHGFPDKILLEKFYMGLDPLNQSIAKNVVDGSFMDKTFIRITQILDKMAEHNQARHSEDTMGGIEYGTPSLTNMIKENQERDQMCNPGQPKIARRRTMSIILKVVIANKINGGLTRKGKAINSGAMIKVDQVKVEAQVEVPIVVEVEKLPKGVKVQEENHEKVKRKEAPKALAPIPRPSPPFPQRLARRVDDSKFEKFYDILKLLSVNIPFVEAFQEMPGFDKYLKDLITKKRTTKNELVNVTHRVSSIIATTTVEKKEDPGAFTIPCTIGLRDFARALCDNGASINLMPLTIYKQAGLSMPRPTSMRLQMDDRSIKRPVGIIDDVLVKVGKFLLPANFVILDCAVDKEIPIILGRPFLATGRALMDSE
ncbi:uncharacterized protein LOC107805954 [Nicotiana tabacum]|uniref:Uncharacterized protein LOC107805954 n=1 Tax=Nicotiana tabacum TaxID=4097 RepID=A0AC58TNT9_TOBAC